MSSSKASPGSSDHNTNRTVGAGDHGQEKAQAAKDRASEVQGEEPAVKVTPATKKRMGAKAVVLTAGAPQQPYFLLRLLGKPLSAILDDPYVKSLGALPKPKNVDGECYLTIAKAGISFATDRKKCVSTIIVYPKDAKYGAFVEPLPEKLLFSDSRTAVRKKMGKPTTTGGGEVIIGLGKLPVRDQYDHESYSIQIEYTEGESTIKRLNISSRDS